ncbi:MAG TPA: glycosyltransferase [Solirubrobacterales bacterium]|nr:glycosyltransferase [Solirubrobacterales bacterium]
MAGKPRICLVSASEENVFFGEILEAFGEALAADGFAIERSVDCFPPPADDLVYLYIPHEYTALVETLAHPTVEQLSRAVAISTEQPGTSWFEHALGIAKQVGAVVDINPLAAAEMRREGVDTEHAPLGYIPSWDVWGGDEAQERPIDLAFLGRHTPERAHTIARCRPALEQRRGALYLTETVKPHVAGSTYYLAGERRSRLLAESKLLLNVHQQKLPYLEWHRILSAVLNGCVVLTEHSLMTEPFEPGTHFVSAREDDLPFVLEALLDEPQRLEAIRHAAYDLVRDQMPMSRATEVIERAVAKAHANPLPPSRTATLPAIPLPRPLASPPPGWVSYVEELGDQLPTRRALMDLVNRTRGLERRVEELIDGKGAPDEIAVEEFGPPIEEPRISVILTVYNHAELAPLALRSVAAAEFEGGVEVIAVDDASVDGSVEALRGAWEQMPWLSGKLVRRSVNGGLPASSRNLAFEYAQGELLFILDADNSVLPRGFEKLTAALDADPEAAFSYGIIEKFDGSGPLGIESWLEWDPDRLRFGNYIDAMALIRREQFEAVGGYPTETSLGGWEDFALWAAFAEADMHGVRVPDFVGRYRVSQSSMLSIAGIDHSGAWTALLRKYPGTMRVGG